MQPEKPQRRYEAACAGCGAQVIFSSLASTHAVCGYCRSTLARQGDALERIGQAAEIFDDYSPLQIGTGGQFAGQSFAVVGRVQYAGAEGKWTEWALSLGDGLSSNAGGALASLSEDNGRFVLSKPVPQATNIPPYSAWILGDTRHLLGKDFTVTALVTAQLGGAEGELGKLPSAGSAVPLVELRSSDGHVLTLDYSSSPPMAYLGQTVELDALKLSGLKSSQDAAVKGSAFNCPNCAHPIQLKLQSSKSCTCPACRSVIDLSQGLGATLSHAANDEPIEPALALGRVGRFEGKSWQILGYQHRMGGDMQALDDEQFGWEEYVLYNAQAGFAFLVNAEDGWSWYTTATGAPSLKSGSAQYLGQTYRHTESYTATTGYVAGEFYWPIQRGYKTFHQEYRSGKYLLGKEQSGQEVVWSVGWPLTSEAVASGFKLRGEDAKKILPDSSLLSNVFSKPDEHYAPSGWYSKFADNGLIRWIAFIIALPLIPLLSQCESRTERREYCNSLYNAQGNMSYEEHMRQCQRAYRGSSVSGGSWGGHK